MIRHRFLRAGGVLVGDAHTCGDLLREYAQHYGLLFSFGTSDDSLCWMLVNI
jgi:hypothetical protein